MVFGASGFTGQFVTEEVAREQVDPEGNCRLPWAVAGRSREKLQGVLERAALKLGKGGGGDCAPGPGLGPGASAPTPGCGVQDAREERSSLRAPQRSPCLA